MKKGSNSGMLLTGCLLTAELCFQCAVSVSGKMLASMPMQHIQSLSQAVLLTKGWKTHLDALPPRSDAALSS